MKDPYASTLKSLHAAGLPYVVIGTYALRIYFPEALRDYQVPDCDLVLCAEDLNHAIELLLAEGWALTIWEEAVFGPVSAEDAAGKFYLRARRADATMDLTYECVLPWPGIQARRIIWQGIPLAALVDIVALKRIKGQPKDIALLARLDGLTPALR